MTTMRSRLRVFFAASLLMDAAAAGAAQSGRGAGGRHPGEGGVVQRRWDAKSLPEDGTISNGRYDNAYFGLEYPWAPIGLSATKGHRLPTAVTTCSRKSSPKNPLFGPGMGHVLIAAQDLFFSMPPVRSAADLISYYQQHLGPEYRVERAPIRAAYRQSRFRPPGLSVRRWPDCIGMCSQRKSVVMWCNSYSPDRAQNPWSGWLRA